MPTSNFIENVLRIDPNIILDKSRTLDYWLYDCCDSHKAIEYINQFHSYFHFEQSNLCLQAAKIFSSLGYKDKELEYLEKAIFQDHINYEAIGRFAGLNGDAIEYRDIIPYNSHIKLESDYLKRFIGEFILTQSISKLDRAILYYDERDVEKASDLIITIKEKGHRLLLLKAQIYTFNTLYELALEEILEAISLVEAAHKSYHRAAAHVYKLRAEKHMNEGYIELAQNDLIKSRDLDPEL